MKILFSLITCCLFITSSCKKSSTGAIPPGNPNNEVKATISIAGATATSLSANGNYALFVKRIDPNGDTVLTILGSNDKEEVQIELINTNLAGNYVFGINANPRQSSSCFYLPGNPFTSSDYYFAGSGTGTLTIESLTANYIKGSFTANCTNFQGKIAQITNGSFKGSF